MSSNMNMSRNALRDGWIDTHVANDITVANTIEVVNIDVHNEHEYDAIEHEHGGRFDYRRACADECVVVIDLSSDDEMKMAMMM